VKVFFEYEKQFQSNKGNTEYDQGDQTELRTLSFA